MRSSIWFVTAGLLAAVDSHAEPTRNIELTVFDPTPTTVGSTFQVQPAEVGQPGDLVISSWVSYASNPLVLGTVQNDDPVVRHRTELVLGGAYAFNGSIEAGVRMPFYMQSGAPVVQPMPGEPPTFSVTPASGAVLGDLTLNGKAVLVGNQRWHLGTGLTLKLPTASDSEFAGTEMPSARMLLLVTLAATPQLAFHANAGAILRKQVSFANIEQGSGLAWGAALSYRMAHSLFIDAEAFGDVVPGGRLDDMGEPSMQATIEGLLGVRYQISRQVNVGLAGGRGLTSGIGAPDFRGVLTLAFTPSARALAPLPKTAAAEPVDPATQDSDFDKINDAVDKCPEEREDKDGFEDEDGCPDPDNDRDGVPDEQDKCPNDPEDADGFEDQDGCPDDDNDKDGIPDADDKCRNEPEKINGIEDNDGCPDKGESLVISLPERLELLEAVVFNGASIAKSSANVLGQLAATLRARADIVRLRVAVHVQPTKSAVKDQALSDKRADAVRDWLVARGIAASRIDLKGYGGTKPLVEPAQKGAAGINDRIELIILERQ